MKNKKALQLFSAVCIINIEDMNNDINLDIEDIKLKKLDMPSHRVELRRSLLTSSHWNKNTTYKFLFWRGGEEEMQHKKITAFGTLFGVITLVLVTAIIFISENAKTAYAEQVAQKSFQAVSTLSRDQREALREKVRVNPTDLLNEAKSAKDLKVLTYEEFKNLFPEMNINLGKENGSSLDMNKMQFLKFTDTNGQLSIVGIGTEDDLPVFNFRRSVSDPNDPSGLHVESGSFSVMGGGEGGFVNVSASGSMMSGEGKGISTFSMGVNGEPGKGEFGTSAMFVNEDGLVVINGKKYRTPEGTTASNDQPSTLKVEGNDVYYNRVKLIPVEE